MGVGRRRGGEDVHQNQAKGVEVLSAGRYGQRRAADCTAGRVGIVIRWADPVFADIDRHRTDKISDGDGYARSRASLTVGGPSPQRRQVEQSNAEDADVLRSTRGGGGFKVNPEDSEQA